MTVNTLVLVVVLLVTVAVAPVAVGHLFIGFRAWQYHRFRGLPFPPPGAGSPLRAFFIEQAALWQMGAFLGLWWRPRHTGEGTLVLLVHGFTQNPTNFLRIERALSRRGRRCRSIFLGLPPQALGEYTRALAHALAKEAGPVDLVCHSMGGVVLRSVLDTHLELRGRVRRVVTLGSPHHGTGATRGFLWLMPEVRLLARRSEVLATLPDLTELAPRAEVTTVAGLYDFVVYPAASCHQEGSKAVNLPLLGHAALLTHDSAVAVVVEAMGEA